MKKMKARTTGTTAARQTGKYKGDPGRCLGEKTSVRSFWNREGVKRKQENNALQHKTAE